MKIFNTIKTFFSLSVVLCTLPVLSEESHFSSSFANKPAFAVTNCVDENNNKIQNHVSSSGYQSYRLSITDEREKKIKENISSGKPTYLKVPIKEYVSTVGNVEGCYEGTLFVLQNGMVLDQQIFSRCSDRGSEENSSLLDVIVPVSKDWNLDQALEVLLSSKIRNICYNKTSNDQVATSLKIVYAPTLVY